MKVIKGMYVRRTDGSEACVEGYKYDGKKLVLNLLTKTGHCHIEREGLGSLCQVISHIGLQEIANYNSLDDLFDRTESIDEYPYNWFCTFACLHSNGTYQQGNIYASTSGPRFTQKELENLQYEIGRRNNVPFTSVVILNIMEIAK